MINRAIEYREKAHFNPSKKYMDLILDGAKEHKLSDDYISNLKKWSKLY